MIHLADGPRVVAVVYREHQNVRIVVHEVVEHLASHKESGNQLARMKLLLCVCYNSLLYKLYNAVREHLGMDSEVLLVGHIVQGCVRNGADTKLQGGTVLNQ